MCANENIAREFLLIFSLFLDARQFPSLFHQPVLLTADVREPELRSAESDLARVTYLLSLRVFNSEFRVFDRSNSPESGRNSRNNRDPMSETCSDTIFAV